MDDKLYLEQYDDGNPNKGLENEFALTNEQISELESLVGRAIFLFNSLETNLDWMIAQTVEDRAYQPGYAITSELTPVFAKKVLVFKSLCGMLVHVVQNEELTREFETLWKLLFKLKDFRNEVAHADWLEATNTYEVRLRIGTDEKGPYAIRKVMPPSFLEEKIAELEDAIERLNTFSEHKDDVIAHGKILTEEDYSGN